MKNRKDKILEVLNSDIVSSKDFKNIVAKRKFSTNLRDIQEQITK